MSYQVTARKWRPMVFEDVIGQSHVTNTLRNAIATNRVAHAFIFSGTRGCGKTTTARILAKALNCLSPVNNNPDNACEHCQEITAGRSMDVIEIDGASNRGIDEIRNLRESVRYTPTHGKYKVYIIDEVHMLTKEAFNALLKTLEEPPSHVIFIFASTEIHKVPMTILSRCQRFDFRRISIDEIVGRLRFIASEEHVTIDDETLAIIARKGDGSMRDAQSIFDQVRSYCGNEIRTAEVLSVLNAVDEEQYFKASTLIKEKDGRGGIGLVNDLMQRGHDLREFVGGLAEHFRNLLVVKSTGSTALLETSEVFKKRYESLAQEFSEQDLLRLVRITQELEQSIRWVAQPRYKLEIALLQMIKMERSVRIEDLLAQLHELKKKLSESPNQSLQPAPRHAVPSVDRFAAPSSGLKIVGTVNAGTLQSVSYVSPSRKYQPLDLARAASAPTSYTVQDPGFDKPSLQAIEPVPSAVVSIGDLENRWLEFVDGVRKTKIALGTVLVESRLEGCGQGIVRIGCPDEYHLSMLRRNKEFLAETLQGVIGARFSVELFLDSSVNAHERKDQTHLAVKQQPSNGNRKVETPAAGEHPLLTLLRSELGAEPVQ